MEQNLQFNMQINEAMEALQNMNLADDFLFDVATVDLDVCKAILELSMNIKIRSIRWKEGQKVIRNLPGRRGIRMDFYVEDESGRLYDVEMQKRKRGNIPKRTRFYQALVDAPLMKSGEESFDVLNPSYIVIICTFDLFGYGKYRYTFENRCEEVPDLLLGDECQKIILNTKGRNDMEVEQSLIDFLHYVEKSCDENVPEHCDERLRHLHGKVKEIKSNREIGVSYMKMETRDRMIREDARGQGRTEGINLQLITLIQKKLRKGKPLEQIADELEDDVNAIRSLYELVRENTDKSAEEIVDLLREKDK